MPAVAALRLIRSKCGPADPLAPCVDLICPGIHPPPAVAWMLHPSRATFPGVFPGMDGMPSASLGWSLTPCAPVPLPQFVGAATARSELWEAAGGRPGLARLCAGRQQQRWLRRGGSGAVLCHRPGGGAAGGRRPAAGPGAHAGASGQWLARAAARSQQSSWLSLPTAGTPGSSLYQ